MNLPAAPLTQAPAVDKPPGTPQPEATPDDLFAALLDIQTARTAPAEGQTTDTPDATVLAALAATLPVAAPVVPVQPAPAAPAAPAPTAPTGCVPGRKAEPPKATPATPAVPAQHPTGVPDRTTPAVPAVPGHVAEAAPVEGRKAVAPKARPVAAPANESEPVAKPAARPAQPATPADPARTEVPVAAPVKDGPVAAQAAPEPRPVLRAERIEALVRLATRHGAAEARLELHPQELGSVVVRLRVTGDGLQATFTASNPDALAQLQQAGADLRSSLEAKGLTLASLDVRAQGQGPGGSGRDGRGWGRSKDRRAIEQIDDEPATVTTSIPVGELVDVQA